MQIQSVTPPSSTLEAAPSLLPLLHAFLRRRTPITRMEWLPIIVADADSPGTWPAAFGSLDPDDQCRILDVLLHSDSGSFADVLLIHLGTNAGQIADEQVRQTLVHEVGTAWGRFEQKLRASTHYRDALTSEESVLRERGDQSIDLAAEIATAEVEVAALRAQEFETDEKFTRLHTFEQQRRELERRRMVLAMFDVEQAQEQVASLRQELEHSERLREDLQNSLQSLEADLEAVRPQVVGLEERQTALTTELSSLEQRRITADKSVADTEVSLEKLRLTLASTQTRNNDLDGTLRSVEAEAAALEQQGKQWSVQCERKRAQLEDLKRHADAAKRHDITAKIAEVIQLLPNDRPDDQFTARRSGIR